MGIFGHKNGRQKSPTIEGSFDASNFTALDLPTVGPLVPDAGKQGQAVIRGGGGASGVRLLYLLDADHLIGKGAEFGSPGNGITWLQSVRSPKSSWTPRLCPAIQQLPSHRLVSSSGPRPWLGSCCPCPRKPWTLQTDGGNFEGAQVPAGVIEIAGHIRPACGGSPGPAGARINGRVCDLPTWETKPPPSRAPGTRLGVRAVPGAGEVTGGCAEAGRDQGCIFAPVHVGVLMLIDGGIAGGPGKQVIVRGVHGVFRALAGGDADGPPV